MGSGASRDQYAQFGRTNWGQFKDDEDMDCPLYDKAELYAAHYTPSNFPIAPVISQPSMTLCRSTWAKIIKDVRSEQGEMVSGFTKFYTEFYILLGKMDQSGLYDEILERHTRGYKVQAKGAILIRIVQFALSLNPDDMNAVNRVIYRVGKLHANFDIRPWQYSVFVQCLISTVALILGEDGTNVVMNAWTNLLGYVFKIMLPPAIKNQVNEREVNTSSYPRSPIIASMGMSTRAGNAMSPLHRRRDSSDSHSRPFTAPQPARNSLKNSQKDSRKDSHSGPGASSSKSSASVAGAGSSSAAGSISDPVTGPLVVATSAVAALSLNSAQRHAPTRRDSVNTAITDRTMATEVPGFVSETEANSSASETGSHSRSRVQRLHALRSRATNRRR